MSGILRRAAWWTVGLILAASVYVRLFQANTLSGQFFAVQDRWMLAITAATLAVLSFVPLGVDARLNDRTLGRVALGCALAAAALAYAGSWLVMERYGLSRDEQLADFAAGYLAQGHLARPIPARLDAYASALMPLWADTRIPQGWWVSNYLPVNSAFRALAGRVGDAWLAGPALLLVGIAALWSAARTIWPDRREPALLAVVAAATSAQLLANAMTPYATTGHFALDALWLACFLRGGRAGHGAALLVGLLASGLHQAHFHPLFLTGFVLYLVRERRFGLAALYAAAAAAYIILWRYLYGDFLALLYGAAAPPLPSTAEGVGLLARMTEFQTVTGLARFAAWQNALMLPLALVGARVAGGDGMPPILWALRASLIIGMLLVIDQGLGWGYRYFGGLMPCFCLLAAAGWVELGARVGRPLPMRLLAAAGVAAALTAVPFALWTTHRFVHPYAALYRAARGAPARAVLVDTRGSLFLQDIVRLDGRARPPLLMDLSRMTYPAINQLCAGGSIAVLDRHDAADIGIPAATSAAADARAIMRARGWLEARGCGRVRLKGAG